MTKNWQPVLLALGGNVGDVAQTFRQAIERLTATDGCRDVQLSRTYRTAPVGAGAGDVFYNAAAALETCLGAEDLLTVLQDVETSLGRQRTSRWGPRPLDLDILIYNGQSAKTPRLTLPHPGLLYRRFALDPAVELAPDMLAWGCSLRDHQKRLQQRPLPVSLTGLSLDITQSVQAMLSEQFGEQISWESDAGERTLILGWPEGTSSVAETPQVVDLSSLPGELHAAAEWVLQAALDEPCPV